MHRLSVVDVTKFIKTTIINSHKDEFKMLVITVRKGSLPEGKLVNRWSRNSGRRDTSKWKYSKRARIYRRDTCSNWEDTYLSTVSEVNSHKAIGNSLT